MELILDLVLDALMDTIKMLPFLFGAYLLSEYLEQHPAQRLQKMLSGSAMAPVAGGLLGLLPQCGFSAAAANFFHRGLVSLGTLLAVFIATSDEAIPILLAAPDNWPVMFQLLAAKLVLAVSCGLGLDALLRYRGRRAKPAQPVPCACHCCHHDSHGGHGGILRPALLHTAQIGLFIFVVTLALGGLMALSGEALLAQVLMTGSLWQPLAAALVGFIPNCASSVLLTQLLLEGSVSFGSALAGLTTGAGAGMLVLVRGNRNKKQLAAFLGLLYLIGAVAGLGADWFLRVL